MLDKAGMMTLNKSIVKSFSFPVGFFLLGCLLLIISGNGHEFASTVSRPANASSWSTSNELIQAFTVIPMILGSCFLLLFVITFSISYFLWQKINVERLP
ncbi:hypothetical protein FIU87_04805 [Bacillus sp. THAF10]|uniref:hypothetical protein n=1 Tax=Bacillus sp. THAF10 TaxID=2587848 RepID=UPI0012A7B999|nr:hypothetical protein [Bacillus sp. THAF10]QFT87969.1 hypothetical protein FIU87_04805 [Bacillus sp. THAF10]